MCEWLRVIKSEMILVVSPNNRIRKRIDYNNI